MAKSKGITVGYIVTGPHSPMGLGRDREDKEESLFFGTAVTVFENRRRAERAIQATKRVRPNFEKEFGLLLIQRCQAER